LILRPFLYIRKRVYSYKNDFSHSVDDIDNVDGIGYRRRSRRFGDSEKRKRLIAAIQNTTWNETSAVGSSNGGEKC